MKREDFLKELKAKLGDRLKKVYEKTYKRIYIDISPKDAAPIADFMFNSVSARFNTTSCIDMPDNMELL